MTPTSQAHHHMEDCCDICGYAGAAESLLTCTQCKIYTEHIYCMRTPLEKPVNDWLCEECESSSKRKQLASSELPGVSKTKMHSGDHEKKVERGKTKFIPLKEAIMLSTRDIILSTREKKCHSKPPPLRIGTYKVERTPVRPRIVPVRSQRYLALGPSQYLALGPSRQPKPNKLGKMETCERQPQQINKLAEETRSVSSPQPCQKKQPREIQWPQTKGMMKQSFTPSPNALPVVTTGGNGHTTTKLRIGDAMNMNSNIFPVIERYSFTPALDALWKGSFSIQGDHGHGEMNHQIQAHPPSRVRRKVYEFSKQMPKVLHFQLVPARMFWVNLFKDCIPDERDIALYFFPIVGERSEDYISLLESISLKDLALRQQIAEVELLVFTSTLLPDNSQCWEGKYFLWGVFHHMKQETCSDNRLLVVPLSGDASLAHHQVEDSTECDMDIDMIGGVNVGRMDIRSDNRLLVVPPADDARLAHHQVEESKECDMDIDMIGGVNVGRMDIRSDNRLLMVPSPGDASLACHQMEDTKECDMDIDMIGGVNVGRMDIQVRRVPVRS